MGIGIRRTCPVCQTSTASSDVYIDRAGVTCCPVCHAELTAADPMELDEEPARNGSGRELNIIGHVEPSEPHPRADERAGSSSRQASRRFTFICRRCRSILEAPYDNAGTHGRCPTCGSAITLPAIDATTGLAIGAAMDADDGELPVAHHAYAAAGHSAPMIRRKSDDAQVIVCPRCNHEMAITADRCTDCGVPFTLDGSVPIRRSPSPIGFFAVVAGLLSLYPTCAPIFVTAGFILGATALRSGARCRAEQHYSAKNRDPASIIIPAWIGIVLSSLGLAMILWRIAR